MNNNRESNIELLRIVAMLMITFGHFIIHGLWHSSFLGTDQSNPDFWRFIQNLLFSLCVIGVNVFVLISGFFRIKLTWKRVVSFAMMCITYNILGWLSHSIVSGEIDWNNLLLSLSLSKTPNWFFRSYWWLMLASPIINRSFDSFTIREVRVMVALLTFLNCGSGLLFGYENSTGYNPAHLIFIYIIGLWLKKESGASSFKIRFNKVMMMYLLLSLIISVMAMTCQVRPWINVTKIYAYNNPLVIASSIAFFVAFRTFSFRNARINILASTVVGVLFVQSGVLLPWTYTFIQRKYALFGDGLMICIWILIVLILLWIVGCMAEYIRKWISTPIVDKVSALLSDRLPLFE